MAIDVDVMPEGLKGVNSEQEHACVVVSEGKPFTPKRGFKAAHYNEAAPPRPYIPGENNAPLPVASELATVSTRQLLEELLRRTE